MQAGPMQAMCLHRPIMLSVHIIWRISPNCSGQGSHLYKNHICFHIMNFFYTTYWSKFNFLVILFAKYVFEVLYSTILHCDGCNFISFILVLTNINNLKWMLHQLSYVASWYVIDIQLLFWSVLNCLHIWCNHRQHYTVF